MFNNPTADAAKRPLTAKQAAALSAEREKNDRTVTRDSLRRFVDESIRAAVKNGQRRVEHPFRGLRTPLTDDDVMHLVRTLRADGFTVKRLEGKNIDVSW